MNGVYVLTITEDLSGWVPTYGSVPYHRHRGTMPRHIILRLSQLVRALTELG